MYYSVALVTEYILCKVFYSSLVGRFEQNFGNPSIEIPDGVNGNSIDFSIYRNLLEEYMFHLPKNPLFEDPL